MVGDDKQTRADTGIVEGKIFLLRNHFHINSLSSTLSIRLLHRWGNVVRKHKSTGLKSFQPINQDVAVNIERLPDDLKSRMQSYYHANEARLNFLKPDKIHCGDAKELLKQIKPNSISLSVWSPPYFVGKSYEKNLSYSDWKHLIEKVITRHFPIIKPGGFLAINMADILCFKDDNMPKISADVICSKRSKVTREDVLKAMKEHPEFNRYQIAKLLNCSEQTVDRRLNGNNIRGGKYEAQTKVKLVGRLVDQWAENAGFYLYDRRIWAKDAAWQNSRWTSNSYRAVDEFEYIYVYWKPGITKVDRKRLPKKDWESWGSRAVWNIPSVRSNNDHEAKFPIELPKRLIKLLTEPGDIVLDCFMGSGTTALACIEEERHFIGIEILKGYVDLAVERISKAYP